ncbi:MAG: nicotinamidase [Candidatus Hydrogenedentes bacterium]|nr:nicotinamidase [Candidatus Hydrogenedentota bacterium]
MIKEPILEGPPVRIEETDALIAVDVQNDFCPGGALPVQGGANVVPAINRLSPTFHTLVFSRDWHPPDHCSFSDTPEFRDGSWPVHCVQHSPGAEFHGDLIVPLDAKIIDKATEPDTEDYDAFQDSDLTEYLRSRGVRRVFVAGLATDYCVKFTALSSAREGFETWLVLDGCRGVAEATTKAALEEMKQAGVKTCRSPELE